MGGGHLIGTAGGGACAFADAEHGIPSVYTPNLFTSRDGLGDEQRFLVDALYGAVCVLGLGSNEDSVARRTAPDSTTSPLPSGHCLSMLR